MEGAGRAQKGEGTGREQKREGAGREQKGEGAGREQKGEGAGIEPTQRDPISLAGRCRRLPPPPPRQKGEGAGRERKREGEGREQTGEGTRREQKGEGAGLEPNWGHPIGLAGRLRNLGIWKGVRDDLILWLIQIVNCNPSGLVVWRLAFWILNPAITVQIRARPFAWLQFGQATSRSTSQHSKPSRQMGCRSMSLGHAARCNTTRL